MERLIMIILALIFDSAVILMLLGLLVFLALAGAQ